MVCDPPTFNVKRSKWNYGNSDKTLLLNDLGQKDCIGFLLVAGGANEQHL